MYTRQTKVRQCSGRAGQSTLKLLDINCQFQMFKAEVWYRYSPELPARQRQRQEDQEFKARLTISLSLIVNLRPTPKRFKVKQVASNRQPSSVMSEWQGASAKKDRNEHEGQEIGSGGNLHAVQELDLRKEMKLAGLCLQNLPACRYNQLPTRVARLRSSCSLENRYIACLIRISRQTFTLILTIYFYCSKIVKYLTVPSCTVRIIIFTTMFVHAFLSVWNNWPTTAQQPWACHRFQDHNLTQYSFLCQAKKLRFDKKWL